MSVYELFMAGEASSEQLVQDAKAKVRWAAEPVMPGESIGDQILKASRELRRDYSMVRRWWYGIIGPESYPLMFNDWLALVERRSAQAARSPWRLDKDTIRPVDRALSKPIDNDCGNLREDRQNNRFDKAEGLHSRSSSSGSRCRVTRRQ